MCLIVDNYKTAHKMGVVENQTEAKRTFIFDGNNEDSQCLAPCMM